MYAVVNHLHLSIPVAEVRPIVEREFPPVFDGCPGFKSFSLVQTAADRAIVIICWENAEAAANGAPTVGTTLFAAHIAPLLAGEQQRSTGEVVVQHPV
jgi:hypothetical protein